MPPYNTGNSVPSADVKDISDNAENFDKAMNGSGDKWTDRLGVERNSLAAIDKVIASLDVANFTFSSVTAGLSGTTDGQYFRVPQGAISDAAFIYYQNVAGEAQVVAMLAGEALTRAAVDTARSVNGRTNGIHSNSGKENPFDIVDQEGKLVLWVDNEGKLNSPSEMNAPQFSGDSGDIIRFMSNYKYGFSETDKEGRLLFGTDKKTGEKVYLGYPLKNHVGQLKNDFFFIGDSITAFTETTSGEYNQTLRDEAPCVCDQGWPVWASMLSAGVIEYAGIRATGGYTIAQILNNCVPVAISASPTFCVVLAGRNNINQVIDYETSVSGLNSIYQRLRRAGITPVCCSMPAQSSNTDEKNLLRYRINEWVRAYSEKNSLPFVDFHKVTTDPATGEWLPGYAYDTSHPRGIAAKVMGQAFYDAVRNWLRTVSAPMAESNTTAATSTNLMENPIFLNITANTPDGWTLQSGSTAISQLTAVKGNVWSLTGTEASPAIAYRVIPITAGKRYGFGVKLAFGDAGPNSIYVVNGNDPAGTGYLAGIRRWKTANVDFGYLWKEFVAPTGITEITVVISATNISAGQLSIFELTEV